MRILPVGCLLMMIACGAGAGPDGTDGTDLPIPLVLSSSQFNAGPLPTTDVFTSLVFRNPSVTPEGLYATEHVDGCYISDCLRQPYVGGVGIDAGTVSVTDGLTMLRQAPRANGYYVPAAKAGHEELWLPGTTLTFQGTGGQVPAFEAQVTVPARLQLTDPPVALDHASPLALTWSGGTGTVLAVLTQNLGTAVEYDDLRIVCELDGAPGAGTISAAVMSHLQPGLKTVVTVGNAGIANTLAGSAPLYVFTLNGDQATVATTQ